MLRLLWLVIIGVLITVPVRAYLIEGTFIASASMEPTLKARQFYFLEKVSIRLHGVRRGDIVSFPSPVDLKKDLVKRVIAVGGDTIELRNKEVILNGTSLAEASVQHTRPDEKLAGDTLGPLTVPAGKVFVMGDNRDESGDSRDWKDPRTGEPVYFIDEQVLQGKIFQLF